MTRYTRFKITIEYDGKIREFPDVYEYLVMSFLDNLDFNRVDRVIIERQ